MIEPLTQNEIEGADDVAAASEKDPHGLDQHQAGSSARQVGGDHYKRMKIQPWEFCEATQTPEQFTGYLLATAQIYLMRFNTVGVPGKGGIGDVEKAHHTLERLIEHLKAGK